MRADLASPNRPLKCHSTPSLAQGSIAPEKRMRALLLQVLYSVRSERQLVEQIQCNLRFRWFVGPAIEDPVWNHAVFSKNRDRLIAHEAVSELFNATVALADQRGLLSGEHFSVDGTLIQGWASDKSMRRKHGSDSGQPPSDWRGQSRSNDTHASTTDTESRLYRKSRAAPALPGYLGHVLTAYRCHRCRPCWLPTDQRRLRPATRWCAC